MQNQELEIESTLLLQRNFFKTGETKSIAFRKEQLLLLKKSIEKNETRILEALHKDLRKHSFEAYATEIGFVLVEINKTLQNLDRWAKPRPVATPLFHFNGSSEIIPEPYGNTLIISPWNYPFQLLLAPLIGAMAAGNTAILKPSEFAPATSSLLVEMIQSIFSPAYIAIFDGGVEVSKTLLQLKFDYIFFTGGTEIGRIVYQSAAKHLTPVTLELGGKSPCIVDKDTHIATTAKRIVWGKFVNAGQTCIAPDYILVDASIKDALVAAMIEYIRKSYGDSPQDSEFYPRIINANHWNRLNNYLQNVRILHGGTGDINDLFISPTIIDSIHSEHPILQEEIFGPILPVISYQEISEAIEIINAKSKPLALYIFSKDDKKVNRVLHEVSAGGVTVNDTLLHIANPHLPFGGVGDSGLGNYHGQRSFDTFSHLKSVLRRSFLIDDPVRYPPYKLKLSWLKKLMDWTL